MKITEKLTITNEDNMLLMARYPDNYFDLAIVDPPYGIGDFRNSKSKNVHKNITWNDHPPQEEYFQELFRVSRNQIVFGVNYFADYVPHVGRIVHDKTGGGKVPGVKDLSDCDIASHSFGRNMKIFHFVSMGNIIGNSVDFKGEMRWHPCQKPMQLYEWLLMNYAKEGDKILDTHGGSMSIALAVHNVNSKEGMNLSLDICELDKEYYKQGKLRYENHIKQKTIFDI